MRRLHLAAQMMVGAVTVSRVVEVLAPVDPNVFGFVALGVWTLSAVVFLVWQRQLMKRAVAAGLGIGISPEKALAYWIIPIANLITPYVVFRDLAANLSPARRTAALAWWLIGFASVGCSWLALRLPELRTPLELAALTLFLASALLCIRMIHLLEHGLRAKESR